MPNRYYHALVALLVCCVPLLGAQEAKGSAGKDKGKGYLGVQIQDVSSKIEKRFKVPGDEGAYVAEIVDESPAEKAGLKEDDVILSFGGKAVYDADDLTRFVQRTAPATNVDLVVWRDGAKKTIPVTVGEKKERSYSFFSGPRGDHTFTVWSGRSSYGMEVSTLTEQLARYFGVPGNEGVLVESVKEKSSAAKAGFQAGDVITKIGKVSVTNHGDVARELSDYEEGDKVDLEVYRKGSKKTLTLEVEEGDDERANYFFRDLGDHDRTVVAPRMRMRVFPGEGENIWIERLQEDALRGVQRELHESLQDLKENDFLLKKRAPLIEILGKRITI